MKENHLSVIKLEAKLIVSGLQTAFCPDVLAHASRDIVTQVEADTTMVSKYVYRVYAQAYLPVLDPQFPNPIINIRPVQQVPPTEVEDQVDQVITKHQGTQTDLPELVNQQFKGRTIEILYTAAQEAHAPYQLWSFFIHYAVSKKASAPFIRIDLRNTDPRTTRGTVTTVQDPDKGDKA